jgi:hypothetical protein
MLWRQAGITDPLSEIDVAEIYVPFSWYEPLWGENLGFSMCVVSATPREGAAARSVPCAGHIG